MGHAEDLLKLRKRVADAVAAGIVDNNLREFYEATLLQILNESERQRQVCVTQAESLRRQASVADGQASAYSAMGGIIYSVLNGYILLEEKAKREEAERAAEMAEKKAYMESLKAEEEKKVEEKKPEEEKLEESFTKVEEVLNKRGKKSK